MKLQFGLISADSHVQLDRNAFLDRMSRERFGDAIPQVRETTDPAHMTKPVDFAVERWFINNKVVDSRSPANCVAMMNDPLRSYYPQRWEEVPVCVYDPIERLKVLDSDGVDAEVLYPNAPVQNTTFFQGDAELELACVQAYNDAVADWAAVSDRYIPLALLPYLSGIEVTVAEVRRVARKGFRGILTVAEPRAALKGKFEGLFNIGGGGSEGTNSLPHFCDPYWEPLWATCQGCDVAIHWHASGGLSIPAPIWKQFTTGQLLAAVAPGGYSGLVQFLPALAFSGVLDRYPRLRWVCAEAGIGWFTYLLEACDHEWERRRLWSEGVLTRPSEALKERLYGAVWFEGHGIDIRRDFPWEHLMWESDFPHNTSTYPDSWKLVEEVMQGVPDQQRQGILWKNAADLYRISVEGVPVGKMSEAQVARA